MDAGRARFRLEARLAWRNVWRNPRRSGLSIAATVFAVYLVVVFVAMGAGTHEKMIEDSVRLHAGHVAVTHARYGEQPTLEHTLRLDPGLRALLDARPDVRGWAPRVVGFALLSKEVSSQGAAVLGIDAALESSVTTHARRVSEGRFLDGRGEREVVLGRRLAERLGAALGDELLFYGVAYSLETAYELFTVVGLVDLPEPDLEAGLALIDLDAARAFYVLDDRVSEIALLAPGSDHTEALAEGLARDLAALGREGLAVHRWYELMPELEQFIVLDDAGMFLMLAILVVVVGFGILNTILMAILERTRELGVMLALGLRPGAVFRVVYLESLLLAAVGLSIGLVLAIPTVLWFVAHPIPLSGDLAGAGELIGMEPQVTFLLKPTNPLGSALTILGVAVLAGFHPARRAMAARPVDALRSV